MERTMTPESEAAGCPTPRTDAAEAKLDRWIERDMEAQMRGSHLDSDDPHPGSGWDCARQLERDLAAVTAERDRLLAEQEADSKRLDWLEANPRVLANCTWDNFNLGRCWSFSRGDNTLGECAESGRSFRQAIDAAMSPTAQAPLEKLARETATRIVGLSRVHDIEPIVQRALTQAREEGEREAQKARFQAAASGMWYTNPHAAGSIMAISYDGRETRELLGDPWKEIQAERDSLKREVEQEKAIVDRIWDIFGRPSYEELKGRSIYDLINETREQLTLANKRAEEAEAEIKRLHREWSSTKACRERDAATARCQQLEAEVAVFHKHGTLANAEHAALLVEKLARENAALKKESEAAKEHDAMASQLCLTESAAVDCLEAKCEGLEMQIAGLRTALAAAQEDREALAAAAQAVVDRWETPHWKDAGPTAGFIYRLRAALAARAHNGGEGK